MIHNLLIRNRLTHTHIQRDFTEARNLHYGLIPKPFNELGHDFFTIVFLQTRHLRHLDFFATGLENAQANSFGFPVGQNLAFNLDTNPISPARRFIENGDIGLMNRHNLFNHTTRNAQHGIGFNVLLNHVYTLNQNTLFAHTRKHRATFSFIAPGNDDNLIALANLVHDISPFK